MAWEGPFRRQVCSTQLAVRSRWQPSVSRHVVWRVAVEAAKTILIDMVAIRRRSLMASRLYPMHKQSVRIASPGGELEVAAGWCWPPPRQP